MFFYLYYVYLGIFGREKINRSVSPFLSRSCIAEAFLPLPHEVYFVGGRMWGLVKCCEFWACRSASCEQVEILVSSVFPVNFLFWGSKFFLSLSALLKAWELGSAPRKHKHFHLMPCKCQTVPWVDAFLMFLFHQAYGGWNKMIERNISVNMRWSELRVVEIILP